MKEKQPVPHCNLSDDVDAGICTQEEADAIAEKIAQPNEWKEVMDWFELEGKTDTLHLGC